MLRNWFSQVLDLAVFLVGLHSCSFIGFGEFGWLGLCTELDNGCIVAESQVLWAGILYSIELVELVKVVAG